MLSKFEQHRKLNGKPKARLFPICSQPVFPWAPLSVAFWVGVWHQCAPAVDTVMGQNPHQDSSPRSCSAPPPRRRVCIRTTLRVPSLPEMHGLHPGRPLGFFMSSLPRAWLSGCMLPPLFESLLPWGSDGKDVQLAL